jgi:hypothetical protein
VTYRAYCTKAATPPITIVYEMGSCHHAARVSFFMNRFRALGLISYNGRIQVHKSLLNVVLLDQLPEHNAEQPQLPFVA